MLRHGIITTTYSRTPIPPAWQSQGQCYRKAHAKEFSATALEDSFPRFTLGTFGAMSHQNALCPYQAAA